MVVIDVRSPQGNVFYILGVFQRLKKQLEKEGIDTTEHQKLLDNYENMEYDKILDEIERITNGTIKFVER